MNKESDEYCAVIDRYVNQARGGNVVAARYLIEEFRNHADALARLATKSDSTVILYLRDAFQEFLEGVPIGKALCVEGVSGRPPSAAPSRSWIYFIDVGRNLKKCEGIVNHAQSITARKYNVSTSTIRAAWKLHGSKAAWAEWEPGFRKDK